MLYGVETKTLNQAVKRNIERFPERFRFQLTKEEMTEVVTICDHLAVLRFSPTQHYVFTEQGVAMRLFQRLETIEYHQLEMPIDVIETKKTHDRFLIIDDDLYHFGASIKDLGKKIFAFDKFIESPDSLLARL